MRLVSLTPSNTEIVWALGLSDQLVGVDDWSDFPPEVVGELPKVGPDLEIDMERVEALRPDLVLASLSVPGMERNVEELRRRGIPHVVLNPLDIGGVLRDIRTVAALLGVPERGEEVAGRIERRMAAVAAACRGQGPELRIYWEWWPRPLIVPGRHSWINEMCRLVGARNVFEDLDAASRPVEPDDVFAHDPDAIVVCWCGSLQRVQDAARVRARPGWERLRAVREGRIYPVPEELFGRPGPRLADGLEMLAGLLRGYRPDRAAAEAV